MDEQAGTGLVLAPPPDVLGDDADITYSRDLATGAAIGHPEGWERLDPGDFAIALAWPEHALGPRQFRPNIMVSVERVPEEELGGDGYTRTLMAGLIDTLPGAHVMSMDEVVLPGTHTGFRLVAAYRTDGYAVALRQYWVVSDGIVTSVGQSCAVESFDAMSEVYACSMRGFVPAVRVPMDSR